LINFNATVNISIPAEGDADTEPGFSVTPSEKTLIDVLTMASSESLNQPHETVVLIICRLL
jgi:hypothetical protein